MKSGGATRKVRAVRGFVPRGEEESSWHPWPPRGGRKEEGLSQGHHFGLASHVLAQSQLTDLRHPENAEIPTPSKLYTATANIVTLGENDSNQQNTCETILDNLS